MAVAPTTSRLHGKEGALFLIGIVLFWQFISSTLHFSGAYLFLLRS